MTHFPRVLPIGLLAAVAAVSACVPAHLQKYRTGHNASPSASSSGESARDATLPGDPSLPAGDQPVRAKSASTGSGKGAGGGATIYAVDKQTFRFQLREADVWETALNVLMRNYNLTIIDRSNGIVTTEWDTYFLDGAVYRNKVSLRIRGSGRGAVDLSVHNNVERLRDASQATGAVGAVWLPAEDAANEVARLVQNMALLLNQPPPVLPPSAIAKGAKPEGSPELR